MKKNKITNCHSEEALATEESGRSMVEMLGVLAVIGVLSVAGIAGYTNAMKKHRANEILNEASKRAVLVAAQAMMGKTGEISLSEFGNNSVSRVAFSKAEIKSNHIVLTVSGDGLADICDQMKNATGDDTVMKVTQDDCSELTFNADMSKGVSTGGAQTPSGWTGDEAGAECSGTRPGACSVCLSTGESSAHWFDSDALCATDGQTCVDGNCVTSAADEPTFSGNMCKCLGSTGWTYCGGSRETYRSCDTDAFCTRDGFGSWDTNQGKCVIETFCTNNGDCTSDEYCRYTSIDRSTCKPNKKGTCVSKADAKGEFESETTAEADGFIRSAGTMDWFSAQNFCRSYGKNLVTLGQIGLGDVLPSGITECRGSGYSYYGSTPCPIDRAGWSAIQTKFGRNNYFSPWTTDSNPNDSLKMFFAIITQSYAQVGANSKFDGRHALCK